MYIYVYKWASHLSNILSKFAANHCNSACVRSLMFLFWMHCQSGETSGNAESGPDQIDVEVGFQKVEMIGSDNIGGTIPKSIDSIPKGNSEIHLPTIDFSVDFC